jgi:hypothetical protein
MASQLKPEISLGFKGPQAMSLGDLLGTATKAVEFSRLSELYPELIKKTQTETAAAEFGLADRRLNAITSGMTALINNPMVVAAEQDPNSINPQQLLSYVTEHGYNQAKMLNIPKEQADVLMAPYIKMATENPGQLRNFAKERLLAGLDTSARTTALGGPSAIGVSTIPQNQPAFRPRGVTPADMTAPMGGGAPPVAAPAEAPPPAPAAPRAAPAAPAPAAPAPAAPAVVAQGDGGFTLPHQIPRAGIPRAQLPNEASDLAAGTKYRQDLVAGQGTVQKASRNVDAVLETVRSIEKDRRFTTGKGEQLERFILETFGDERFKQLSKDIANVELAVLQASGGSMATDAGKALVAKANGDETYPPSVLVSVARRLVGDLTRIDMEAQAAQKFAQQYGDANMNAFKQAWAANSDQRIFEAIAANKGERDPARRKEALDKLLPKNREELSEFLTKYENINRLTQTGRLR